MKKHDKEISNYGVENVNTSQMRRKRKIYELYTVLKFYATKSVGMAIVYALVLIVLRTRSLYDPYTAFHHCLFHILYHLFPLWLLHIAGRIFEATIRSRFFWWFRCCEIHKKGESIEDQNFNYSPDLVRSTSRETFAGKALYSVRTFFGVSSLDIVGKATSQPNGPNIALDGDTENINDGSEMRGSLCTTNPLNKLKNAESLEMRSKSTA